jgi:hypothetical protein
MESKTNTILDAIREQDESLAEFLEPMMHELQDLEKTLKDLRSLPRYQVHSSDKHKQKVLPVGKLYKEYLTLYTATIKTVLSVLKDQDLSDTNDAIQEFMELAREKFGGL